MAQVVQLILLKKPPTLVEELPSPEIEVEVDTDPDPKISVLSTFVGDEPKELNIELFEGFADGFIYNKNKYIKFLS